MDRRDVFGVPDPADPDVVWVPMQRVPASSVRFAGQPPPMRRPERSWAALSHVSWVAALLLLLSSLVPVTFGMFTAIDPQKSPQDWETAQVLLIVGGTVAAGSLLAGALAVVAVFKDRPRLVGWGILSGLGGLLSSLLMFIPEAVYTAAFGLRAVISIPASLALIICGFIALAVVPGKRAPHPAARNAIGVGAVTAALGLVLGCGGT